MPADHTITKLLQRAEDAPELINDLLPMVYDELRKLASLFLAREHAHTLNTTELVNEAYLRLFGQEELSFVSRQHFFTTAGMAMRRILVDQERARQSGKVPKQAKLVPLEKSLGLPADGTKVDILALDSALQTLGRLSPQQVKIVELRFFGGLGPRQIASLMALDSDVVNKELRAAKLWLRREMGL